MLLVMNLSISAGDQPSVHPPASFKRASHASEAKLAPNEFTATLAVLGFLAAALMGCLVVAQIHTGTSVLFVQSDYPLGVIARRLGEDPRAALGLRVSLGLNTLFICTYTAFFTLLAACFRNTIGPWATTVGLAAMLLTALCDIVGTHHVSAMLHAIERQLPVADWELRLEIVMAGVRYHGSYVCCALFAFGFWREGKLGRVIAAMLWLGYLPLGAVLSAYPVEYVPLVSLRRFAFFVVSFCVSGVLFLGLHRASSLIPSSE